MYYEEVSDDLPIEALVAINRGDEDWEDLVNDSPTLATGCSRSPTYEPERLGRFEAEPITIKALITRPRHR